jgi:hypothetical protein
MSNPAYTYDIPQPTDIPAKSQSQILQNFTSIDDGINGFARNHVSLTNGTSSDDIEERGKHNFVELVSLGTNPTPPSGLATAEFTLYNNKVGTSAQLYFVRGASSVYVPLTCGPNSVPTNNNPGWTFLPGGLLMVWGTFTGTTQTYATPFSDVPWTYQATPSSGGIGFGITATKTSITWSGASSGTKSYIAIGPS